MRNANRFYRGEPLTAARLNDLVEAANRSGFGATAASGFGRRSAPATIKNESEAVVPRFGTLEVADFWRPAATRDEAVARFAASGIELVGTAPTGSGDAFLVVALEPIPPGEFGPVAFASGGAFLAEVVGANDGASPGFATPATGAASVGSFVAAGSGPFRIVARSASGVCLLTPVVEAPDPFVFDYVERQPSYLTGSHIFNGTWRNERSPNGLKCYLCYCDLYDDENATLGDLFAKKLKWDVTAMDWTGIHKNGIPYDFYKEGSSTVLTPVCCGIRATVLSGSVYDVEDVRTWSYRNGFTPKPPLTGRAFFPYPITLEYALSWKDAEDERRFFTPYQCVFSKDDPPYFRCVLDHPRRHFESVDDVPDVFFPPGQYGARARLLCPVCYVPRQAEYIFEFVTIYETDDAFRFALETRPFKNAPGDRYAERYWEADGTPPDPLYSAVAIGYKTTRFTKAFSSARGTPGAPYDFAVSVDGASATFSWAARQYAATYALLVENLAGKIVAVRDGRSTSAVWAASESGDYVARLAAVNAAGARSPETNVAFSIVVPASE